VCMCVSVSMCVYMCVSVGECVYVCVYVCVCLCVCVRRKIIASLKQMIFFCLASAEAPNSSRKRKYYVPFWELLIFLSYSEHKV